MYVVNLARDGYLTKMCSFQQSKQSDKRYAVEVRRGIFIENLNYFFKFVRAVVNIPIQTLVIFRHDCYFAR